jgi:23S rRNA C2498 (ribose-2'-O)-methylase RlmM
MANTTGNKYGGRQKGTPNKLTKELRSVLKDILYRELEQIQEQLDALNPKERIELLIKLMPYVLPKVTSVSHTTNEPLDWG